MGTRLIQAIAWRAPSTVTHFVTLYSEHVFLFTSRHGTCDPPVVPGVADHAQPLREVRTPHFLGACRRHYLWQRCRRHISPRASACKMPRSAPDRVVFVKPDL